MVRQQYCCIGNISHKRAHYLGEWGGKLYLDKEIIRVGVTLANLWYPVSIPKKNTHFRSKYSWNGRLPRHFMQVFGLGKVWKLSFGKVIAVFRFWDDKRGRPGTGCK